jgi:hypothetical protein
VMATGWRSQMPRLEIAQRMAIPSFQRKLGRKNKTDQSRQ